MRIRLAAIAALIGLATALTPAQTTTSAATRNPFSRTEIISAMQTACDWQLTTMPLTRRGNDWIRSAFFTGDMALYRATGNKKYLDAAFNWGEQAAWTPNAKNPRHADNQCCGQTYCEIYAINKDPKTIEPFRAAVDAMLAAPKPGRVEWWWCDSLFMAPPAYARLSSVTGDPRYVAFMNDMFWDTTDFLYDTTESLYYRDANYFNKATRNGHKVFWSRGNGWVVAGIARTLEYLPNDNPMRPRFIKLFRDMCAKLATLQGSDGLWRSSLLDPDEFPTPESSGSGFFCYAMAWGINNGILDRDKYLPIVRKAWQGLLSVVSHEGRVGYVQQVAGAPGPSKPDATQEYAVGAFLLAGSEMLKLNPWRYDFGDIPAPAGYEQVDNRTRYTPETGFGWVGKPELETRDRGVPDPLKRDFVFGHGPATFRVDVPPGNYVLTLTMGDMDNSNHVLQTKVNVPGVALPELRANRSEFVSLTAGLDVTSSPLDITFSSPADNWVVNALSIETTSAVGLAPVVHHDSFRTSDVLSKWADLSKWPNPVQPHYLQFRNDLKKKALPHPTGLSRNDYLHLITGEVDFWKTQQNAEGAIIDPYKKVEFQYSTPCFALAATTLVAFDGRKDLVEPAARAMDWATYCLRERKAATNHEDFYAPQLAHALPLLKPYVSAERSAKWEENIRSFDPYLIYRSSPGHGNWNVVALSGEYLFHKLGLRPDTSFITQCLAGQGESFCSPWGMYVEVHMPYDLFPRIWAADMMAAGYAGPYSKELSTVLDRGALTSLFMQSPNGELPAGGRSTHHQWNEAEQCLMYEMYGAKALKAGDSEMAGVYKRAAHLALRSMMRWVRPSGEMWIVKNRFDPSSRHGFDGYSGHSQYNLLPMAMLSIAYQHAAPTERVAERLAPAEVGGFVLDLREFFHKVIANAGGMYLEVETSGDPHYNPTGLIRINKTGMNPQLGPSDGLTSGPAFELSTGSRTIAAVGPVWKGSDGNMRSLAALGAQDFTTISLIGLEQSAERVGFQLLFQGYLRGPSLVSERYVITPADATLTCELPDYPGPIQMVWPMLADDGQQRPVIRDEKGVVSVSLGNSTQTFTPIGADRVTLGDALYGYRSGLARLGKADYSANHALLKIRPVTK